MHRATQGVENLKFKEAVDHYATDRSPAAISKVMRLACESISQPVRERAETWLFQNIGVKVVTPATVHILPVAAGA